MVTLITEQLRKQTLEEPYRKAFSFNVNTSLPAVGSSPSVSRSPYASTPESNVASYSPSKARLIGSFGLDPVGSAVLGGEPLYQSPVPSTSVTDLAVQSSPPPPPPKRHCPRSLSVPEDLSRCRAIWRPSACKVWTAVKRRCQSGGGGASSGPLRGLSSSVASSSLTSSSSPTFFSLALSPESPLPWSCPWEPCEPTPTSCSSLLPASSSSCSPSPAPRASVYALAHRRFSLSPVHIIQGPSALLRPPQPSPLSALAPGCSAAEPPGPCPSSPTSARSTPCCPGRALPRCRSQPCDMQQAHLKRRRDQDAAPRARPGLNFSKMTQSGADGPPPLCMEATPATWCASCSPADIPGQSSIGPLSESEEEEDDGSKIKGTKMHKWHKAVFERECTELDLNLIEEN